MSYRTDHSLWDFRELGRCPDIGSLSAHFGGDIRGAGIPGAVDTQLVLWFFSSVRACGCADTAPEPTRTLESGLVVIAFFPLILLVSYSAQSYLNQTYEQIGSDAQTRFDLVRQGVEPSAIGVLGIPAESALKPMTYLPASARVIDQGSDYIHWIDAADDIFSSRRYKKLSEYRSGQVTTLSGPINQGVLGLSEAGEDAYLYTSEFWRYFQTRFYGLGAWYIGIVATLWLSAL